MIATTIQTLQPILGSQAHEHAVVDDADPVAKDIGFLHRVGGQHHGSILIFLAVLQNVPKLTTSFRVQTCRWLVEKDDLWAGHQADGD